MSLILLVSLVCLGVPGSMIEVAVVKHTLESEIVSGDAQCNRCPCWLPDTLTGPGCSIVMGCQVPCGYWNIRDCPECQRWGPFEQSDADGCVDMDLLPVPRDEWIYWLRVAP